MLNKSKKYLGLLLCLGLILGMVFCFSPIKEILFPTCNTDSTKASFHTFTNDLFKSEVTSNTITLHYTLENPSAYEITDYPITFGNLSSDSMDFTKAQMTNYLTLLKGYDYDKLSQSQQLTYDILYDFYSNELQNTDLAYYSEALSPTIGIQAQLPVLLAEYTFHNEQDIVDYLTLMAQMDTYYTSIIDFEKKKSSLGLFMSSEVADAIISQCSDFIAEPDKNYLLETFNSRIDALTYLSDSAKSNYKLQNKSILYSDIIPSYHILIDGLTSLKDTCKNSQGLCYFKEGQSYYEYLVRKNTGSARSIVELKQLLNTYMKQDLNQITQIAAKDPTILTTSDHYSFALTDPALILEDLKAKISSDFPTPPIAEYKVKYVESSLSKHLSPAFYLTPPIDNSSQNLIYINPSSNYSKIDLYTTLAHEGYPGHLYQNIYFNAKNTEPIRSILNYGGYTEGWATYVEMYSYHFANIDSDLATLLQLNNAVTLYLYATMDIGINYYGWTRDDTRNYLSDFGIDDEDTVSKVYCAIISEPTNYLKYCVGYLEFMELKKTAKETLGSQFHIKDFHQFLLDTGPAPFYILEKYMDIWMKNYEN